MQIDPARNGGVFYFKTKPSCYKSSLTTTTSRLIFVGFVILLIFTPRANSALPKHEVNEYDYCNYQKYTSSSSHFYNLHQCFQCMLLKLASFNYVNIDNHS